METLHQLKQCSAHSKQTGNRCKNRPIPGSNVCRFHGGGAPQVLAAARARIAAMVDPTLTELFKLIKSQKVSVVKGMAIRDLLDRAGLKPTDKLQLEGDLAVHDPGREKLSDADLDALLEMLRREKENSE